MSSPVAMLGGRSDGMHHRPLDKVEWGLLGLEIMLALGALAGGVGLIFGWIPVDSATAAHLPFESPVLGGPVGLFGQGTRQ
jgi:hypothetical protein